MSATRWLRSLFARDQATRDVDDEIRFHLEMEQQKLIEQGMDQGEARRQARLRFGGEQKWRHEVRDVDGIGPIERVRADARFGLRVLRRNPVFAFVSIVTLALGIGASTAIFSVVDGILLRALPYPAPDELVTVWADYTERGGPEREWWGYPNFFDLRQDTAHSTAGAEGEEGRVFDELALWTGWNPTLTHPGTDIPARQVTGALVSHGMLARVLRVQPSEGQLFRPADDQPGAPPVAIVSERLWAEEFDLAPGMVGRELMLNGQSYTVIGMLPGDFRQPLVPNADIWTVPGWNETDHPGGRGSARMRVIGRLAPDTSLEQARQRIDTVAQRLERDYPEMLTGVGMAAFPLKDDVVQGSRSGLLLLLGAVVATLLIVCINLANLLLARGSARTREFSVRAALGASGPRLARQLLTESLLLAGLGGAAGIALAFLGTTLLVSLAPAGTPRLDEVAVDLRVLAFAAGIAVLSGLVFGALPALQATRARLAEHIGRTRRSGRLGEVLVIAQVGAALALLVSAVLMVQSFSKLQRAELGYEPDRLAAVQVFAPPADYPESEQAMGLLARVHDELRSLPGVDSVARTDTLPLSGFNGDLDFAIEGQEIPPPGQENIAWFRRATPEYFETAGIEIRAGRGFAATDHADAPPVVIVNETLARQQFGDAAAVGQRININSRDNPRWREIVGVAADVRNFDLREEARPAMYAPFDQVPFRAAFFVMRTNDGDPALLLESARTRIASVDPNLAPNLSTASSFVEAASAIDRFVTSLLAGFAAVALLLAAVGLYGVINYRVQRRTREIGLRLALGSPARSEGIRIVRRSFLVAAIGVALGVVAALAATRALTTLLYDVEATDPATYAVGAATMLSVAALAALLPARRAARVDPMRVLSEE